MEITSLHVYVATLAIAATFAALSGVMWLVKKEPGQRAFWRSVAVVMALAFNLPALIIFFKRDASAWWLLISVVFLVVCLQRLLPALFWKGVPLVLVQHASDAQREGLKIVHLSDLHLCGGAATMEGGISSERVYAANQRAFRWACEQRPDLIAVTGDATDSGEDAQWQEFASLLSELPPEYRDRTVVIPGNHDLTITLSSFNPSGDGKRLLEYEKKCAAYVRHLRGALARGKIPMVGTPRASKGDPALDRVELEVPVSQILEIVAGYLAAYDEHPPTTAVELRDVWRNMRDAFSKREAHLEWRRALHEYSPRIVLPPALQEFLGRESVFEWPSKRFPLIQDFLQILFPMVVHENERVVVIATNSNAVPSSWIADGALGRLGDKQLRRLESILKSRDKSKCVVLLVHHHVGCPQEVQAHVANMAIELKALQMKEGAELCALLRRHGAPTVLMHGHKHVGYWAAAGDIKVISAGSVPYGDKMGGNNCCAYTIDEKGGVSLAGSVKIDA